MSEDFSTYSRVLARLKWILVTTDQKYHAKDPLEDGYQRRRTKKDRPVRILMIRHCCVAHRTPTAHHTTSPTTVVLHVEDPPLT